MIRLPGDDASVRPKHPGVVGDEHGDRSPVAARLRDLRTRRGITKRELAASTGIVERTVARAETQGAVAFDTIRKLARFYAVSIDYIAHGSDPSAPTAFDDASEALPISEQALRAMRGAHRLDPETTERLRARIVSAQFSTSARLSTVVSFLEDELSAIQARRGTLSGLSDCHLGTIDTHPHLCT